MKVPKSCLKLINLHRVNYQVPFRGADPAISLHNVICRGNSILCFCVCAVVLKVSSPTWEFSTIPKAFITFNQRKPLMTDHLNMSGFHALEVQIKYGQFLSVLEYLEWLNSVDLTWLEGN